MINKLNILNRSCIGMKQIFLVQFSSTYRQAVIDLEK